MRLVISPLLYAVLLVHCELDMVLTVTSLKMLEVLPPELVVPQPDTTASRFS